jgi:hypothetical protein
MSRTNAGHAYGDTYSSQSPLLLPGRSVLADASRNPPGRTVGIALNDRDASEVYQLRYRVYVHEQAVRLPGIDWARRELVDQLDPHSCLWYARDGDAFVGAIAQTIVGPEFDVSRLPASLAVEAFPRSRSCRIGFSSRFVIAPDSRSTWVLPSLARASYEHGRQCGVKFAFMTTNPRLVPLFERLGYMRYTASLDAADRIGLVIPMVLPMTDHEHLRKVRSACLPAAMHFPPEPEWGEWLRATHPMIDVYYGAGREEDTGVAALVQRLGLPEPVAAELRSMSFVHHFPAGTPLRQHGDRVTYTMIALDGQLGIRRLEDCGDVSVDRAPDGVAFSRAVIRCETNAAVLFVPDTAVVRLTRRYPEHGDAWEELLADTTSADMEAAQILR